MYTENVCRKEHTAQPNFFQQEITYNLRERDITFHTETLLHPNTTVNYTVTISLNPLLPSIYLPSCRLTMHTPDSYSESMIH